MKRCPSCKRTYTDASLNFCLEDGSPLVQDAPPATDPNATIRYPPSRDTAEPPPTEIYLPQTPGAPPPPQPPQWSPMPATAPARKSNAIWWVLGGLAVLAVIGIGFVVVLIALSKMGGNTNNSNANLITNRNTNGSTNTNASPEASVNTNSNSDGLPAMFTDDFSETKWGAGNFRFGDIWYAEDEYHMRSKENTFIVMYGPSEQYRTQDATIKVTARSVDGSVPSAGFGLMFHCAQSKAKQLEDYALLIYPETEPAYEVIMHKEGVQSTLVSKTKSTAIRPGSTPNQLEVRVKGSEIEFYINGQFLTSLTDTQNFKGGRAGFYTSDTVEVAFDDLEIKRQTP